MAAGRASVKGKGCYRRRGSKKGNGTEKGCSCDSDAAAEVEQQADHKQPHTRKCWDTSQRGQAAAAPGAADLCWEGPRAEATRTAGTSARAWRSRSRLLAKSFFCQGVGTVRDVGGWGSRMAVVGTMCWVTPRCWGSEPWVTILRATSSGKHRCWEGWTVWECRVWGVLGSRAAIKAQGPNLGL